MFTFKINHLLFLFILQGYYCQRRIISGSSTTTEKRYMVQLLKAPVSPQLYEGWLCGGALVSTQHIVTSAACVTDVNHLYAIAGYSKYVRDEEVSTDQCIRSKRKKIVSICIQLFYKLLYDRPEVWSNIDIAVARVESPYDFKDQEYARICSYTPAAILVNYNKKHQEPGTYAIVLGWGHEKEYREDMNLANMNVRTLNFASVMIQDKQECKNEYKGFEGMEAVIDEHMICTYIRGNINDRGDEILKAKLIQGCIGETRLKGKSACLSALVSPLTQNEKLWIDNTRKSLNTTDYTSNADQRSNYTNNNIKSNVDSNIKQNSTLVNKIDENVLKTRRQQSALHPGICQNDHGGPLVTWVGGTEYLIGVASAFKISSARECIGPYLYTSTECNSLFLDCVLNSEKKSNRREMCKGLLLEKNLKLVEKTISWKDHPDGPADNERNITTSLPKRRRKRRKEYEQLYNISKFLNSNITNTDLSSTLNTQNSNLTAKALNIGNTIIPKNLIYTTSVNTKESESVRLTSATSTNLSNNNFTNLVNDTPTKLTNFEPAAKTILMKNVNKNLVNTTNVIIKYDKTTNSVNVTSIKNASVSNIKGTTTISLQDVTKNVVDTTSITNETLNTRTKTTILFKSANTNITDTTKAL